MFIVNESITVGVEFAEGLRKRFNCNLTRWKVDTKACHMAVMAFMLFSLVTIWVVSCILAAVKVHHLTNGAVLWLGCVVAPPGVWVRWYLARLNGVGIGKNNLLKWFPIGTFLANVIAACIMAALSVISKAVCISLYILNYCVYFYAICLILLGNLLCVNLEMVL